MEQLARQEEFKQRRIYKWCMAAFALEGILIVALVCVLTLFPKNRALHNIVGFTLITSFIPVLIAVSILSRLKITRRVIVGDYSLPYKLRKDKAIYWLFGGITLLLSMILMPAALSEKPFVMEQYKGGPEIFRLPGWTILPLVIWGPVGFLVFLISWQGVTLFGDHLLHNITWTKHKIFYRDIRKVDIFRRSSGQGGHTYVMSIHHTGAGRSPLEINLALFPAKDCAIMLNVIQKFAPNAAMDTLAEQMKQGEFPMV